MTKVYHYSDAHGKSLILFSAACRMWSGMSAFLPGYIYMFTTSYNNAHLIY